MASRKRSSAKTTKPRRTGGARATIARAPALSFAALVHSIADVHERLVADATKAVNVSLTLRNWLIGCYIREYELGGSDRAAYGEHLLESLSTRLQARGVPRIDERELRRYRAFYLAYPQIRETLPPESVWLLGAGSLRDPIRETPSPEFFVSGSELVARLAFSHFAELLQLDDSRKHAFYELECLRGNWSVRELKRQIASLYYERSALSRNKKKVAQLASANAESFAPAQVVRDPYVFEFLGLKPKKVVTESALEDSLLDKLQIREAGGA